MLVKPSSVLFSSTERTWKSGRLLTCWNGRPTVRQYIIRWNEMLEVLEVPPLRNSLNE